MRHSIIKPIFCFYFLCCPPAQGKEPNDTNWPQSSGPNANWMMESHQDVPTEFSVRSGTNVLWTADLPESGQGGLTVWDDTVFLSVMKPIYKVKNKEDLKSDTIVAMCVDATNGKVRWQQEIQGMAKSNYLYGFSDSTTPAPARLTHTLVNEFAVLLRGIRCSILPLGVSWRC